MNKKDSVRLSPPQPIDLRAISEQTRFAMFIYAARQVHKDLGEKIHYCATPEEAFSLKSVADIKVVRFAGGLHSMLEAELIASEQVRIDQFFLRKPRSFAWRKLWPFSNAA